jgi:hypothetical protein
VALGNQGHGIHLSSRADETVVFGGIVSANQVSGIDIERCVVSFVDGVLIGGPRSNGITIVGNFIGVRPAPVSPELACAAVPNASGGVHVSAGSELESFWPEYIEIGIESTPGFLYRGNVVSGNGGSGVWIEQGGGEISLLARRRLRHSGSGRE